MIKDIVVWSAKTSLQMAFWVFILAISWDGHRLYDRAYAILVDNRLVAVLSDKLVDLWDDVAATAVITYDQMANRDETDKSHNRPL